MPKVMKSLNTIHRCQSLYRTEKLSADLCAGHHAFIFTIRRLPGRSQEELARDLYLNKSTVARTCGQLEERGYVYREPNTCDKRQTLVYPTDKALAILPKIREISVDWNKIISSGVSESEMEIFNSVLKRMEANAKAAISDMEGKL